LRRFARPHSDFAITGAAVVVAALAGVASHGKAGPAAALIVVSVALIAGLLDWRRSLLALLLYFTVDGVISIALYPNTGPGALAKDALFVIPAYVGYAVQRLTDRRRIELPVVPVVTLGAIAALVVVQMLNPGVPKPLVALIGAKTWLFYVPMVLLGHDLIRDRADLDRFLLLIAVSAAIPCTIGVIEALLIYTGHASTVYGWYGAAASAVTQGFAEVSAGSSMIRRIPSTFTFATQFYSFTVAAAAIAYAAWRNTLAPRGKGFLGVGLIALIVVASMLSGARSAVLLTPAMLLAAVALDVRTRSWLPGLGSALVVIVAGLGLATVVLGASLTGLITDVASHGVAQLKLAFVDEIRNGFSTTTFGLGTGIDTIASRYALPATQLFQAVGGAWQESWWAKALLELGIAGLIAAVTFMASIVTHAVRTTLRMADPGLRAVAAAITAYLLWAVVSSFKAQSIDLDPENVYFYLFIGVLLKLPALDRQVGQGSLPLPAPRR
jgi:hypothetical protein